MSDIAEKFWSAPPVTRTLVAAMFAESALVLSGLVSAYRAVFFPAFIFKFPPELWRLMSSFLLTSSGIGFVFDLYFTWMYGSGLELNSPRFNQPGDFFIYICFVETIILATAGFLLGSVIFTQALIMAMIYTFAQDNRGTKAHFIIVQIPIELLPWAMLTLTLVLSGFPAALSQSMGIVAAHLYDFLTRLYPTFQGGRNFIQTPNAIRQYFSRGQDRSSHRAYGQAIRPGQPTQQPQTRGWASGLSNNWNGRGTGRRLGGD